MDSVHAHKNPVTSEVDVVALDPVVQEKVGSIDMAIESCASTIRAHTRATVIELAALLALFLIIGLALYRLAQVQGAELDSKRSSLRQAVFDASASLEDATKAFDLVARGTSPQAAAGARSTAASPQAPVNSRSSVEEKANEFRLVDARERIAKREAALATATEALSSYKPTTLISDSMLYGAGAIAVVLIGIFAGFYRTHLREITRNEQHRLGLLRIRIAASNSHLPGFGTEVRIALTNGAFDSMTEESSMFGRKKIESPLPGHPTTDIATLLVSRLMDQVDVVLQPKRTPPEKAG